jgi:hypothetical protein
MKGSFFITIPTAFFLVGVFWYQSTASVCPAPLSYRIGVINDSFEISSEEALARAKAAEAVWENVIDRDLFVYDETSDFTIDFVFDERQQAADSEVFLRENLDAKQSENEKILKTLEDLQVDFKSLSDSYNSRSSDYEKRLFEYNTEVNKYNDRGGAPDDVFKKLNNEHEALNNEAIELSDTVTELNELAEKINTLNEKGNRLVDSYNKEVTQYNNKFSTGEEFTQGDYQKNKIHVYKFSNDTELATVLAHEFGHSLGLGHVEGTSSLMYYLLEDPNKSPTLSSYDLSAYYDLCGTEETFTQTIRRKIREVLAKF